MTVSQMSARSQGFGVSSPNQAVRPFLSVVMPAYNEEAAIESVIRDHIEVLTALGELIAGWEIVCVDDASSDRTLAILERLDSTMSGLKIVRHSENKGISGSFTDGFGAAAGTHIYATGADGQWPAGNLARMVPSLMAGADLVVGVRRNKDQVYGLHRRLVSFAFNFCSRLLFGVRTIDAGAVKLGVRDVFRFDLVSRSVFVEAERIVKAQRLGYRVGFVPVEFRVRGGGRATGARWGNIVASIRDCLRCARIYGVGRRFGGMP